MNNKIEKMGRFELWGSWPPELVPTMKPLLKKFEPLLPPWCQIAHVSFCRDLDGADCGVDFEYRRIRLRFGPSYFESTEPERAEIFAHEFMHGYLHHLYAVAYDHLETILPGPENELARTLAQKNLKEVNEGVTQDLTKLICGLI